MMRIWKKSDSLSGRIIYFEEEMRWLCKFFILVRQVMKEFRRCFVNAGYVNFPENLADGICGLVRRHLSMMKF